MSVSALWPDLAGLGLGVLAAALGAWYWVDNVWAERIRQFQADRSVAPSAFDPARADLIPPQASEAEEETGAEEILAASPVADRFFGAMGYLVARTRQATDGHRWVQFAATASVVLLLTCLGLVLIFPLLLTMVLVYVSDSGHDIRLRIVVALFLVDIALQVVANL